MKKLILVTLTAFAASWLLAEARRGDSPRPLAPPAQPTLVADNDGIAPAPRKKGEPRRGKMTPKGHVVLANDPAPAPSPKSSPPAWFPTEGVATDAKGDASGLRVIVGRVSASEDRAKQDLRQTVERAVSDWIAADVSPTWKVPSDVLDSMVQGSYTQELTKNLIETGAGSALSGAPGVDGLYTLYRSGQQLDFSTGRKAQIVGMYHQDLANRRLQRIGGGLVLALAALAVFSGYIKADEATKGYYTKRLRVLAAAGLGVAGAVAYRILA
jgi:hypothetical protein